MTHHPHPTDNIVAATAATIQKKPFWLRLIIWLGIGFILLNTVGVALFFVAGAVGKAAGGMLSLLLPLFLFVALPAAAFHKLGGTNVVRSLKLPKAARYTRQDNAAAGGCVYHVQPARASRLIMAAPVAMALFCLLLVVITLFFLIISGGNADWLLVMTGPITISYFFFLLFLGVASIFVLPGARWRRPSTINLSATEIGNDQIRLPLDRLAALQIGNNGIKISEEPLMPGPRGISTAAMAGRGMGRKQVARSYTIEMQADGVSERTIIAGGLTADCAEALMADLTRMLATFGRSGAQ
ncbi:MAG: hypothetical protein KKA05_00950 [Alphaproteobacteria bacterium]|nr:hypothetical protein [Alphaproteobacteria bacterium]MBU0859223.1 hypothetical protein [Alphaproteobacteria bacterium]